MELIRPVTTLTCYKKQTAHRAPYKRKQKWIVTFTLCQMTHTVNIVPLMQRTIMEGSITPHKLLRCTYMLILKTHPKIRIQVLERNSSFKASRTYSSSILCLSSRLWCLTTSWCARLFLYNERRVVHTSFSCCMTFSSRLWRSIPCITYKFQDQKNLWISVKIGSQKFCQ